MMANYAVGMCNYKKCKWTELQLKQIPENCG